MHRRSNGRELPGRDTTQTCPYVAAKRASLHRAFVDPSRPELSEGQRLAAFRQTRDEIATWLDEMVATDFGAGLPLGP